ncbi:Crinkler (CRN) family protein [Phytophthora infestans T30-4]|uniref:Crinkler (CRN) family protein n=1 Tax=Phytophthora infestans (strain T30-4) TaxID=403677 RepID=D0P0U7_PHYIT|nr:Crinkler (CRN) family protein [Phytophthora infestans T30-4]EEY53066.1 Crinkler (CRN) family protein [Phytophthora infestans T30-4]|eukprot:XP_002896091.1 Crinkler (CRN) family protein [Phytophthora infestans T30-4]
MVKLFCCIVGVAGSAFSVEVNEGTTVDDLKDEIARKQKYDFAASKLQLFLAKAGGNAWLSNLTEDVKKLKKGEKTALVESLTQGEDELQGENPISECLEGMDPPEVKQIHVLVVAPVGAGVGVGQDVSMDVPAAVPMGPTVNLSSCEDLLAFLENDMINKEAIVSRPHILESDSLQFQLVGREKALMKTAKCFLNIIARSGTASTDRTEQVVPVCSGISGLGKTRMLEEGGTILQEMGLDPDYVERVIVPYCNGFSPQPVEKTMPIAASFSWRLLYRFFLDKNCALAFDKWFKLRLPRNGGRLKLSNAIKVIDRKLRRPVHGKEKLYLFVGVDEYQKIERVKAPRSDPDTSLLRELVEAIAAFLCTKSSNLVVLPMFAGTDLDVIASGSIANSSFYVTERLPMTLLTLDQVFTFVENSTDFAGLLRQSQVRRYLFMLGGVPRWVVEYLLKLRSRLQGGVVSLQDINNCYVGVWTNFVDYYLRSPLVDLQTLVRLAAFAVSGVTVSPISTIDGRLKWSRLRDSSLCLLSPRESSTCDVRVPYPLLANIGSTKTLATRAERDFATALDDMSEMVDSTMFALQPWQSWEIFGACFYAVRINALLVLGHSTATLGDLLPGARMSEETRQISVKLVPSRVVRCAEAFGSLTPQLISNKFNQQEKYNWTSSGCIAVNGDGGAGVDIFFALNDAVTDNVVVFVDQRKRQFGKFQPCHAKEYLGKLSVCPDFLVARGARLVRGVLNCVSLSNLATYDVPHDCFLLSRNESEQFHGTLAYHPACTPFISVDSACQTALKSLLRGTMKAVDEAAEAILTKRNEPSGGFRNSEDVRSFIKFKRLEVVFDDKYAEFSS